MPGSNVNNKHTGVSAPIKTADYLCEMLQTRTQSGAGKTASRFIDVSANFSQSVPSSKVVTVSGDAPTQTGNKAVFNNGSWRSLDNCRYREGNQTELTCTARFVGTPAVGEYALIGVANKDGTSGFLWGSLDNEEILLFRKSGSTELFQKNQDGDWVNAADWDIDTANVWALGFLWHGNGPCTLDRAGAGRDGYKETATIDLQNVRTDAGLDDPDVYVWIEASANMSVETSSWALGYYGGSRDNLISQGNSYDYNVDGTLAGGATFTGEWVDLAGFAQANTVIQSNQTLSMDFEYSMDGSTALSGVTPQFMHTGDGTARRFQLGVYARYFRVKLENTSGSAADLLAQTILLPTESRLSIHRVGDDLAADRSAEVVKSINAAEQPDGTFTNTRGGGRDESNSDSTPLTAGSVYRGTWFEWSKGNYTHLISIVDSDENGTLQIDFSNQESPTDGDDSDVDETLGIAYVAGDVLRRVTPVQGRWVRHRYTNGVTNQGTFSIEAIFGAQAVPLVMERLDQPLLDEYLGGVTVGTHQAKDSGGTYGPIGRGGAGDGLDFHVTGSEPRAVRKPMTREQVTTVDLTTTSQQIDTSPLTSRSGFVILVDGTNTKDVHINLGSAATTSSPRLSPGDGLPLLFDETVTIHGRSNTGTQRIYLIEGGEPL